MYFLASLRVATRIQLLVALTLIGLLTPLLYGLAAIEGEHAR
jgi:hypothetical protein